MSITLQEAIRPGSPYRILRVDSPDEFDEDACGGCLVTPLDTPTVRGEGLFIVRSWCVDEKGEASATWQDVVMPEGCTDSVFIWDDGIVLCTPGYVLGEAEIICAVAVEAWGDYQSLYYSVRRPGLGIQTLREAVPLARDRATVAAALGYMLRDEGHYREAYDVFKSLVEEGQNNDCWYWELAGLCEEMGCPQEAEFWRAKCSPAFLTFHAEAGERMRPKDDEEARNRELFEDW